MIKPSCISELHEEINALRQERDQLRADLAAERERAEKAEQAIKNERYGKMLAMQANDPLIRERDAARAELAEINDDLRTAATELRVNVAACPPGTVPGMLLAANVLLRRKVEEARAELAAMKERAEKAEAHSPHNYVHRAMFDQVRAEAADLRMKLDDERVRAQSALRDSVDYSQKLYSARARVAELEGLVRNLSNGVRKALKQEILDAPWRMQAHEFVKQAESALAGGEAQS